MALDPEKRLDRVMIHGFRSIRALEDFELTDLNVLVGANGSGKSNLISFFRLLHALMTGTLDRYIRDSGGVDDLLFDGPKTTPRMRFAAHFGCGDYRFALEPSNAGLYSLTGDAPRPACGMPESREPGESVDGASSLAREADGPRGRFTAACRSGKPSSRGPSTTSMTPAPGRECAATRSSKTMRGSAPMAATSPRSCAG